MNASVRSRHFREYLIRVSISSIISSRIFVCVTQSYVSVWTITGACERVRLPILSRLCSGNDLSLLLSINRTGFAFYNDIPVEERKDWYISYDFHILNKGRKILVNHKLTPLRLTSDGRVWLALCVVSAATHTDAGHIEMHHIGTSDFFEYNTVSRKWKRKQIPTLTDGEKSVLTLSMQGYTMVEIADKLCLSPDTIKKYRQRIFEKLDVRNISEAIAAATNNKLI